MSQPDHSAAAEALPSFTAESFPAKPDLECDIVMKGGITSGVIYPLAVCELAQTYRIHSVGGASAGAIAAAVAAAAEVGRASLGGASVQGVAPESRTLSPGFLGLSKFPDLLSEKQADGRSLLFHLFRPQPQTRRLFELLIAGMDGAAQLPQPAKRWPLVKFSARLLARAARWAWRRVILGLLPGLVVVVLGLIGLLTYFGLFGMLLSLVMILLGVVIALLGLIIAVLTAVWDDVKQLPSVGFGISSGRGESDGDVALTPWLYSRVQELAGRRMVQPLTFGDLQQQGIDFQVMTTNLSRAQPMVMPWSDDVYFFEPAEFEKLFGKEVVKAMMDNPPPLPSARAARRDREVLLKHAGTKRPFPRAEQLPIIVATRMSLSFPLLISAVPLYAIDYAEASQYGQANRAYADAVRQWRRQHPDGTLDDHVREVSHRPTFDINWFSDGGLTANLPVQFFDAPLPSRPTFAIDLAGFDGHKRSTDERENSYLPDVNQGGLHRRTARWKPEPVSQLISFGRSLLETARTWVDEASLVMPGYRDRVVTVYQGDDEGGLNLSMPDEVVDRLSIRGRFAAQRLVDLFGPTGDGWTNHRWLRFRTATAALSDWFAGFEKGYTASAPDSYEAMLNGQASQPSYPMTVGRRTAAQARITGLRAQINVWATPPEDAFTDGRPQQPPALRLVPKPDADS